MPDSTSRVFFAVELMPATDGRYPVTAISAGEGNGLAFAPQVLEASLVLWEGASVYVDHAGPNDWGRPGGRSIRDLAGVLHNVYWDPEKLAIRGQVRFLASMRWLCQIIDECMALQAQQQPAPRLGLSADLQIERRGTRVLKIVRVNSLDVVMNPARGGEFTSELAEMVSRIMQEEGDDMDPQRNRDNGQSSPAGEAGSGGVALPERTALASNRSGHLEPVGVTAGEGTPDNGDATPDRLQVYQSLLEARLADAGLPRALEREIRAQFGQRAYLIPELDGEIARAQALVREIAPRPKAITGLGPLTKIITPVDRLQIALDRLMGLPIPDEYADTPRLSGIREFWVGCTGDVDMAGVYDAERVQFANITTSTMTSIVKNSLNKVLLQAFELRPQWWKGVVWEEDFNRLQQVSWITLGGFGDLPTVDEGAAYVEQPSLTDVEETSDFEKKGGYVAITLETIDRDDVSAIRAIPRKLGLAANRTLSAAISAIFTANSGVGPTLAQDTTALFHTNHGNLGSTALSLTSWDACIQAMYTQAEPASGKRMGLRPSFLLVPIELEKTALEIMRSKELVGYGGGTNTLSPSANVRAFTSGVVVVPDFTDANDWAAVASPYEAPGVCVGYRYGRAPELFLADNPLMGTMFTHDVMRVKVRFIYTVGIGEYRGLYKANVT